MEENRDEKYIKRVAEVNAKLNDPKIKKKIDTFINSMVKMLDCDVEVLFDVYPEVEEYDEYMESEDFKIPSEMTTMNLGEFINHIKSEDFNYNVYIDPVYLKKGLNEINDVLTTTVDNNMIIVPISHKNNKK